MSSTATALVLLTTVIIITLGCIVWIRRLLHSIKEPKYRYIDTPPQGVYWLLSSDEEIEGHPYPKSEYLTLDQYEFASVTEEGSIIRLLVMNHSGNYMCSLENSAANAEFYQEVKSAVDARHLYKAIIITIPPPRIVSSYFLFIK